MARTVKRVRACLHHVAKNGVIEITGVHSCTLDGLFGGMRGQVDRRDVRERSGIASHRGSRSCHNHHVGRKHRKPPFFIITSLPSWLKTTNQAIRYQFVARGTLLAPFLMCLHPIHEHTLRKLAGSTRDPAFSRFCDA